MDESFVKLTNAAYRVLEFFPESDPLKNRAKDKALVIMENLTFIYGTDGWASLQREKTKTQLLDDIDIFLGYLWIGKTQGWLSSINYLIISHEYEKIKKELGPQIEFTQKITFDNPAVVNFEPQKPVESKARNEIKLPDRQAKIVEFLGKNEKAQVMDLQKILPDITKRTIRRDLDELLRAGKIDRMGEFNQVFYKIKG